MQCFSKLRPELKYIYVHVQVIRNCTLLSHVDIYNVDGEQQDVKQRKQKPGKHCVVMFCNKTNAERVSLHQFPQTLVLDNTSGFYLQLFRCNILQIFIYGHIYFLAKDVFFLPLHWLAVSTLTPCYNKICKVVIYSRCWIEEIQSTTYMIGFTKRNSYQLCNCHKRER